MATPYDSTCIQCRYVLWPRIDQKTCLKSITAAGLEVVVLPLELQGDQLVTNVEQVQILQLLMQALLPSTPMNAAAAAIEQMAAV